MLAKDKFRHGVLTLAGGQETSVLPFVLIKQPSFSLPTTTCSWDIPTDDRMDMCCQALTLMGGEEGRALQGQPHELVGVPSQAVRQLTPLHQVPLLRAQQCCGPPAPVHVHPHLVLLADGGNLLKGVKGSQHCGPGCAAHKEGHLQQTELREHWKIPMDSHDLFPVSSYDSD